MARQYAQTRRNKRLYFIKQIFTVKRMQRDKEVSLVELQVPNNVLLHPMNQVNKDELETEHLQRTWLEQRNFLSLLTEMQWAWSGSLAGL